MDQRRVERVDQTVGSEGAQQRADHDADDDGGEDLQGHAAAAERADACRVCRITALVSPSTVITAPMASNAWMTAAKIGRAWSTVFRLAATGTYTTTRLLACTCSAMCAGSASSANRTAAVSKSPPANAFGVGAHRGSQPARAEEHQVAERVRRSSATGTVNGATPAPGNVISSSSPARASRIAPSDSGITAPVAGKLDATAVGRLEVLHRRAGRERLERRRVPAVAVADEHVGRRHRFGGGDAVDGGQLAEQRVVHRGGERDLCAHLFEAGRGVERRLRGVDHAAGCDHADHRGGGGDGGDGRGPRAECTVVADAQEPADAERARTGHERASAKPMAAAAQLFAPTCSGRLTEVGEVGTTECRTQEPDHHPADPGRDDRDRQRAPPPVDVVDPRRRPTRPPGSATMSASAGITMLASRKPVSSSWITPLDGWSARGCTSCAPLSRRASVVSSASRASRSAAALVLDEHLGHGGLATQVLDDRLRHEQHREAARRGHDLLLALRREQVLGREADADDFEWPGGADPERLDRRAGRDVEVVGGVLLDDGDRTGRVAVEVASGRDREVVDRRRRSRARR